MDLTFSEEQKMSAAAAQRLFADYCTSALLRQRLATGASPDERLWRAIGEAGLAGILAPEDCGGLGLTETDFVLIAEACGHALLPEPLIEHAGLAVPLLTSTGARRPLAHEAAAGHATLALGHPANPLLANADTAAAILLEHRGEVHLVERERVQLRRQESIDPFRRLFRVEWEPTHATRIAERVAGTVLWSNALERGALFTAAQCLGIAQRCVEIAVDYAKTRRQFGKAIGSYQAVKHLLASVQVKIEFARPVVYAAAAEFSARDAMSRARISHAKLIAAEAADLAARTALQIHGAMGYSWEVDVHFFLKRSLVLTHAWGAPAFHRARIAERIFNHPVGAEHTFAREREHA